jgi:hypothetical protein
VTILAEVSKPSQRWRAYYLPVSTEGGPRNCNCEQVCPGYDHCGCIYIYDEGHCRCICGPDPVVRPDVVLKARLDSRVDLHVRGASLGEVASLLAVTADAEIFVPAGQLDQRRELHLEQVSLDTVIRELGLMAVVRP